MCVISALYQYRVLSHLLMLSLLAAYPFDSVKTKTQAYFTSTESTSKSPGMLQMFNIVFKNEGLEPNLILSYITQTSPKL